MIQRLFVAIGLVTSLAIVSCGVPQQFSFIPNCAPEPQSGPNAVAKVRYKVDVRTTSLSGMTDFKTETQVKALNEAMDLNEKPADILLPLTVELLNDKDAVLLTRSISDPELNNTNLHNLVETKVVNENLKESTRPANPDPFDFFSKEGHRFIDKIEYEWGLTLGGDRSGRWRPKLVSRQVFLVDKGDVIACNVAVSRPTPPPPPCNAQLLTAESSQVSTYGPQLTGGVDQVAVGPNGSIYAMTGDGLVKFTGASGTATPVVSISDLKAQTSDPAGNVYFYYSVDHAIHKISPTGGDSVFKQGSLDDFASDVDFKAVSGMAADSQGNVYIIDRHSVTAGGTTTSWWDLRKITPTGTVSTLVSKPANEWPIGTKLTVGVDGTVYIADSGNGGVHVVSPSGAVSKMPIAVGVNLGEIRGMAVDCAGNLYVSEESNHRIRTITPAGVVATLAGTGSAGNKDGKASEATFNGPSGLYLDAANNVLYVADRGNRRIRKISAQVPDNVDALSLQGFTETSVSANPENTQELIVGADHSIARVETFIHDSLRAITGEDRNRLDDRPLHSWVSQFKGPPTSTFRFRSTNGKMLNGRGETAEHTARWFLPTPDASFFDGSECKGRLEWSIQPPNTGKSIVIYSNEFVLATKAAPSAVTVPLRATNTASLPLQNQVTFTCTTDGKAQGLYDAVRKASGGTLPEQTVNNYSRFDQLWQGSGGTLETIIQPGTVVGQTYTANGAKVVINANSVNPLQAGIDITLPWPSQDIFSRFYSAGQQNPVTGWFAREYSRNGQVLVTLISNQVTWGTAPKEVIQQQSASGGGGGAVAQPAPTITSVTPNSGGGGTAITIAGTNFRAGATVKVNGVAATGVTVNSATSITATVAGPLTAGAGNVEVRNTENSSATSAFTVTAPTITGIAPNNGAAATAITITGTNFRGGAGAGVTVNGVAATGVTFVSATQITATTPAGQAAGTYNVVVTNTDTTSVTSVGGYTVNGGGGNPTVGTLTPDGTMAGVWTAGQPFTITGTNFQAGLAVTVGGVNATVGTVTATQIDGTIPNGVASGNQPVVITNPDTTTVTYNSVFCP